MSAAFAAVQEARVVWPGRRNGTQLDLAALCTQLRLAFDRHANAGMFGLDTKRTSVGTCIVWRDCSTYETGHLAWVPNERVVDVLAVLVGELARLRGKECSGDDAYL